MKVTVINCGPTANASEETAIDHLRRRLEAEPGGGGVGSTGRAGMEASGGDDEWILLTNLAFSVTHRMQSDEIDIIAIGPPGVRVIEVKHWSGEWIGDPFSASAS